MYLYVHGMVCCCVDCELSAVLMKYKVSKHYSNTLNLNLGGGVCLTTTDSLTYNYLHFSHTSEKLNELTMYMHISQLTSPYSMDIRTCSKEPIHSVDWVVRLRMGRIIRAGLENRNSPGYCPELMGGTSPISSEGGT